MIRLLAMPTLLAVLLLHAVAAAAQQKAQPASDELDVTMQIIVDPDAKLPDEVVRRIPLPARKPRQQPASSEPAKSSTAEPAAKKQERAREAQELGREMSEQAKERAQDANDQREQARRSIAEEHRRNHDPPPHPSPPGRPPR
jgi:hypothetical protein